MATAKEAILHNLRRFLEARAEVSFAYLHGSFLDGDVYHDVDVALCLDPPAADPFDYEMALSAELTRALRLQIDAHILNHAPLGFQHQALRGQLLFARDEELLTDYIERVSWEYMEFSHHLREFLEAVTT